MAVPFRKTSKKAKRERRSHQALKAQPVNNCKNCGATVKPYKACLECGYYKGKEVIKVKN